MTLFGIGIEVLAACGLAALLPWRTSRVHAFGMTGVRVGNVAVIAAAILGIAGRSGSEV